MITEREFLENSRFKRAEKIVKGVNTYFPLLGEVEISIESPMDVVTWKLGMTLKLLAFKYYGSSKLWWVLAYANKIDDPFADIEINRKIYIPSRSEIPNL